MCNSGYFLSYVDGLGTSYARSFLASTNARFYKELDREILKCICNENFDFGIFASSENFIFSDHFDTNLVEKFEIEVCEFLV